MIPKITAVATIDEPPKLNKGKGIPVTGITPITVDMLMKIWNIREAEKPASINFSKSDSVVNIILATL